MKHWNPKNSRFRGFLHPSWVARLSALGGRGDGDKLGVDLAVVLLQEEVVGVYPAKLPVEGCGTDWSKSGSRRFWKFG